MRFPWGKKIREATSSEASHSACPTTFSLHDVAVPLRDLNRHDVESRLNVSDVARSSLASAGGSPASAPGCTSSPAVASASAAGRASALAAAAGRGSAPASAGLPAAAPSRQLYPLFEPDRLPLVLPRLYCGGLVDEALRVPGSAVLLVSTPGCARRPSVTELGHERRTRVAYLELSAEEIGAGSYLPQVESAAEALFNAFPARFRVLFILFMGVGPVDVASTRLVSLRKKVAARHGIPVCLCRVDGTAPLAGDSPAAAQPAGPRPAASRPGAPASGMPAAPRPGAPDSLDASDAPDAQLTPRARLLCEIYRLLEEGVPVKADPYSVNFIGAPVAVDPTCEIYGYFACATFMRVRQVATCATFDDFLAMRTAARNVAVCPEAIPACEQMRRTLGIPYLVMEPSPLVPRIGRGYERLAAFLDKPVDFQEEADAARAMYEGAREDLAYLNVAVGPSPAGDPFEVALQLSQLGAHVRLVMADSVNEGGWETVDALREREPEALVVPTQSAAMLGLAQEGEGIPDVKLAIGFDAGRVCPGSVVAELDDGYRWLGFEACSRLIADIAASLKRGRTARDIFEQGSQDFGHSLEDFRAAAGATMNGALKHAQEKRDAEKRAWEEAREIR